MKREEVKKRKERSDKKRDIKPTISLELYDCISRISYITNKPMKDIAEYLCINGLRSKVVVDYISQYFRRKYWFDGTYYNGSLDRDIYKHPKLKRSIRLTIRFQKQEHSNISGLSHCLDMSVSSGTRFLLECSIKDVTIVDRFLKEYTCNLNQSKKEQLKEVMKYIRKNNPYRYERLRDVLVDIFNEIIIQK